MGWQDAPILSAEALPAAPTGSGWQSAPLVETPRQNVAAESGRSLGGFAGNVIKSGYNVAKGVVEAVMHPLDTATALVDIGAGALQKAVPKEVADFINKFEYNPEAALRASKVASAVGGVYADRYGSIEGIKKTLYEDPVGAAADLSTILSLGAGAVRQAPAVTAGALKVAGAPEMAANVARAAPVVAEIAAPVAEVGRAINPMNAIPLETAGKLVAKGGNYLANVMNPKAAALVKAAEGQGPEIINALRTYEAATPGYVPTAGEATAGLNLTRYPGLQAEVSAMKEMTTPYYRRGQEQNAALIQPLNVEPTAIDMYKAQRTGLTKPLYEEAVGKGTVTPRPLYNDVLKEGKVADVSNVAKHIDNMLEKNPGNTALVSEFNAIKKGLTDKSGALRTDTEQISSALDNIKAALAKEDNNFIKGELTQVKDMIADAIPGYTKAQKEFAKLSKPINQMEVADFLKTKLGSALRDENKLTPASYANALANAPSTIKRATGLPSYEKLSEILTPKQMKIVEGIKSDIANKALFEEQAAAGMKGGKAIPAEALPVAPHLISKVITFANMIINRLQGRIDRKMAMELATEMLNPETAALSLEQALTRQKGITNVGADISAGGNAIKNALRSQPALGAGQINNALAR
jgi:hypothetical protein